MDSEMIEKRLCIQKCVEWITSHNFKKVGLEFPDNPEIAPDVSNLIRKKVGFLPYILQDSNRSCGDCCVDERTAHPRNIEAIIHFGRTCLTPTEILPVLYVLGSSLSLNSTQILNRLQENNGPKFTENLILVYDISNEGMLDKLSEQIKCKYENLQISRLITPPKATLIYPVSSDDEAVNKNVVKEQYDLDIENDKSIKTIKFNVREVDIPSNSNLTDYNFIFIGPRGPSLTALQLRFSDKLFYQVDALGENLTVNNFTKMVLSRSKKIEQIKEAKIIGILFSFINEHSKIVSRLRKLIKSAGKRCYTFFMGKINEPKLGNIVGVDTFIYVACPESSLFDRNDNAYIYQKIVAPWEVEVALNPSFEWSLNFETNFREFLSEDRNKDLEVLAATDLREEKSIHSDALVERIQGVLCELHQSGAGEVLQSLSWQGLTITEEKTPVGQVVEGLRGIASTYTSEPSS